MRLFLGLFPDALEAAATARVQHAIDWPAGARLVPPANLHVTLHFLGEVDPARVDALAHAVAVASPPVALSLDRFAGWHDGIAVLEPDAVPAPLAALHQQLGDALAAAGFAREARPYRPHVTLARHADGAPSPAAPLPVRWSLSRYALVQSSGGRYLALRHYALDGR